MTEQEARSLGAKARRAGRSDAPIEDPEFLNAFVALVGARHSFVACTGLLSEWACGWRDGYVN
jgi:hypothetical protein